MVSITKEDIEIDETLKKKIKNTLSFLGIKAKVQKGSIRSISNTNIAYVEPHKLEINKITYLFFNNSECVYVNTLENEIHFNELQNYIKTHKN